MPDKKSKSATDAPIKLPSELVVTRVLSAPHEKVFEFWTRPDCLAQWWGPNGFTNPVCEVNLRPGGSLRIDMRGPDGKVYPMTGEFKEIRPPELLEFTSSALDEKGKALFQVLNTVSFSEYSGKTTLTLRAKVTESTTKGLGYLKGMSQGWNESLDRLADYTSRVDREIVTTKVVPESSEKVFKAWTDPKQVVQWWGPTGFTNTIEKMEVKAGGVWQLVMHGPDGTNYKNKSIYTEIKKPERIVYEHQSVPQFQMTATFEEQSAKQTKVTMRMLFETPKEREKVIKSFGAIEGARETLARLAKFVGAPKK